ncbi:hypothetical protein ACWCO3_34275, partial [Micromonospora sp. NPDC002411]
DLWDPLADLPMPERERLVRSEVKLLDYLDRLATAARAGTATAGVPAKTTRIRVTDPDRTGR